MSFDLELSNGDLVIEDGDVATVQDSDKLIQDVLKCVSTPIGSNPFFPQYGSPISKAMIGLGYDQDFNQTVLTQQLITSLTNLQTLQMSQAKINQIVTPKEQISTIKDVDVSRAIDDPRYLFVNLTVLSKAFQSVPISFTIVQS